MDLYEGYASKVSPRSKLSQQLDLANGGVEKHLLDIADELVDLDKVTAALNLKNKVLKDLQQDYSRDIAQQRYGLLRAWKEKYGTRATYDRLLNACVETSNSGAAEVIVNCLNVIEAGGGCDDEFEQSLEQSEQHPLSTSELQHKEQNAFYCFDCNTPLSLNSIERHRSHDWKTASGIKSLLTEQLIPLTKNLASSLQQIECAESEVRVQGDSVANKIEKSFAELESILAKCKQELLTEAKARVSNKLECLSDQKQAVSSALQIASDCTAQCKGTDEEVLSMYTEIQRRIDSDIAKEHKEGKNLEPVEEADLEVEVDCVEGLKQLCQTQAKVTQLAVNYVVTGEGLKSAEVNKVSEFQVAAKLSNGKPSKRLRDVSFQLKRLACNSINECKVGIIKEGEYRVQYTPTARGCHKLIGTIDGQEVAGSPFPVFVSSYPTQPIQIIPAPSSPNTVAINSSGEIVVGDQQYIKILSTKGEIRCAISAVEGVSLSSILGKWTCVTVDNATDNVYAVHNTTFISSQLPLVKKLTPGLKVLMQMALDPGIVLQGLAMAGDKVVGYDHGNTIWVWTKDLELIKKIPKKIKIVDLCGDEDGNLYIADCEDKCVRILDPEGTWLRSFPVRELGRLCVARCRVYIASEHNVWIYNTEGEYLASFGEQSDGRYGAMTVDMDGFVYVCLKKTVLKF